MAVITKNCTIDGLIFYNGSWEKSYKIGAGYVGNGKSGITVSVIKFTAPSFDGKCTNINMSIPISRASTSGTEIDLYFALCTSDINKDLYRTTNFIDGNTDTTQLANGSTSVSDMTTNAAKSNIIINIPSNYSNNIESMTANTTYYLILWQTDTTDALASPYANDSTIIDFTYKEPDSGVYLTDNYGRTAAYDIYICNSAGTPVAYDVYIKDSNRGNIKCIVE